MYHTARAVISQIIGGIVAKHQSHYMLLSSTIFLLLTPFVIDIDRSCLKMTSSTVCCMLLFRIFKILFLKNSSFSSDEVPLSLNGAQLPSQLSLTDFVSELPLTVFWRLWVKVQLKYSIGYFSQWCGVFLCMYCILHIDKLFRKQPHTITVSHSKVHCVQFGFFMIETNHFWPML